MANIRCILGFHKYTEFYKRYRVIGPDQWYSHIKTCEICGKSESEFVKIPTILAREFERDNNVI